MSCMGSLQMQNFNSYKCFSFLSYTYVRQSKEYLFAKLTWLEDPTYIFSLCCAPYVVCCLYLWHWWWKTKKFCGSDSNLGRKSTSDLKMKCHPKNGRQENRGVMREECTLISKISHKGEKSKPNKMKSPVGSIQITSFHKFISFQKENEHSASFDCGIREQEQRLKAEQYLLCRLQHFSMRIPEGQPVNAEIVFPAIAVGSQTHCQVCPHRFSSYNQDFRFEYSLCLEQF